MDHVEPSAIHTPLILHLITKVTCGIYTPSIHTHAQDWRVHYEQMHVHKEGIESTLSETQVYLDKLHQEISKTLEKITSREKYINTQVHTHLTGVWIQDQVYVSLLKCVFVCTAAGAPYP